MNISVLVLPPPRLGFSGAVAEAEPRRFLLDDQPTTRTIGELFPILEEHIKELYLTGWDRASFEIKYIRDEFDNDLRIHLSLAKIFPIPAQQYLIKVVSGHSDRQASIPVTSTLRPKTPFKRPLPQVPTFAEGEQRKRRKVESEERERGRNRDRDLAVHVHPDQPLRSSERDEIEDGEEGVDGSCAPSTRPVHSHNRFSGKRFSVDKSVIEDSDVDVVSRARSKSRRRLLEEAEIVDADDEAPEAEPQNGFQKPALPARDFNLTTRESRGPGRQQHMAEVSSTSRYIRNPYSIERIGPSMQTEPSNTYSSNRHRVRRDVHDVPDTEHEEIEEMDERSFPKPALSGKERSRSASRTAISARHQGATNRSPLITPDSSNIGKQLGYNANGERVQPLTTVSGSARKSTDTTSPSAHLAVPPQDRSNFPGSPVLAGVESDHNGEDPVQPEGTEHSSGEDDDMEHDIHSALPSSRTGGLSTPFQSFSANQASRSVPSPPKSKKTARELKTNVTAAEGAHHRLASATASRPAVARESSAELPMERPTSSRTQRNFSSVSENRATPSAMASRKGSRQSIQKTPSPTTGAHSTAQISSTPQWLAKSPLPKPSQSTQKVSQTQDGPGLAPAATHSKASLKASNIKKLQATHKTRDEVSPHSAALRPLMPELSQPIPPSNQQQSAAQRAAQMLAQRHTESSDERVRNEGRRLSDQHTRRQLFAKERKDRQLEQLAKSKAAREQKYAHEEKVRQTSRAIHRLADAERDRSAEINHRVRSEAETRRRQAVSDHMREDEEAQAQLAEEECEEEEAEIEAQAEEESAEAEREERRDDLERLRLDVNNNETRWLQREARRRREEEQERGGVDEQVREQMRREQEAAMARKKKTSDEVFGWMRELTPTVSPKKRTPATPRKNVLTGTTFPSTGKGDDIPANSRAKSMAPVQSSHDQPESSKARQTTEPPPSKDLKRKRASEPSDATLTGKQRKLDFKGKGKKPVTNGVSRILNEDAIVITDTESDVQFLGKIPPPRVVVDVSTSKASIAKRIKLEASSTSTPRLSAKSRTIKACLTCYKKKRKCEWDPEDPNGICFSCKRSKNECGGPITQQQPSAITATDKACDMCRTQRRKCEHSQDPDAPCLPCKRTGNACTFAADDASSTPAGAFQRQRKVACSNCRAKNRKCEPNEMQPELGCYSCLLRADTCSWLTLDHPVAPAQPISSSVTTLQPQTLGPSVGMGKPTIATNASNALTMQKPKSLRVPEQSQPESPATDEDPASSSSDLHSANDGSNSPQGPSNAAPPIKSPTVAGKSTAHPSHPKASQTATPRITDTPKPKQSQSKKQTASSAPLSSFPLDPSQMPSSPPVWFPDSSTTTAPDKTDTHTNAYSANGLSSGQTLHKDSSQVALPGERQRSVRSASHASDSSSEEEASSCSRSESASGSGGGIGGGSESKSESESQSDDEVPVSDADADAAKSKKPKQQSVGDGDSESRSDKGSGSQISVADAPVPTVSRPRPQKPTRKPTRKPKKPAPNPSLETEDSASDADPHDAAARARIAAAMASTKPLIGRALPPLPSAKRNNSKPTADRSTPHSPSSPSSSSSEEEEETADNTLTPAQQSRVDAAPLAKQGPLRRGFLGKLGAAIGGAAGDVVRGVVGGRARRQADGREWWDVPEGRVERDAHAGDVFG